MQKKLLFLLLFPLWVSAQVNTLPSGAVSKPAPTWFLQGSAGSSHIIVYQGGWYYQMVTPEDLATLSFWPLTGTASLTGNTAINATTRTLNINGARTIGGFNYATYLTYEDSGDRLRIGASDNSTGSLLRNELIFQGASNAITVSSAANEGMIYSRDLSSTFIDNSLVSKKYVDSKTLIPTNGLQTISPDSVGLGGKLTGPAGIDGQGQVFAVADFAQNAAGLVLDMTDTTSNIAELTSKGGRYNAIVASQKGGIFLQKLRNSDSKYQQLSFGGNVTSGQDRVIVHDDFRHSGIEVDASITNSLLNSNSYTPKSYVDSVSSAAGATKTLQQVTTAGNTTTLQIQAKNYYASGTAGQGYADLPSQSVSPISTANRLKIYADSLNRLSWKNSTYRRTFRVSRASDMTISAPFRLNPVLADSTDVATTFGLQSLQAVTTRDSTTSHLIRFKIANPTTGTNEAGYIGMVNKPSAALSNFTIAGEYNNGNPSNIRFQVKRGAHIGFNIDSLLNSMFTVGFNTSYKDGNIQLRSRRLQNGVSGSGGEYLEIQQDSLYTYFNNFTGSGFKFINASGLQSVFIGQTGTITMGGSSAGVNPGWNIANSAGSNRVSGIYDGTNFITGTLGGSFGYKIQTNGTDRLSFTGAGVGTFSAAPIIPLTGILQGNGASAISTVTTTGTGNVVLNTSPTISSPTLSGTPISATPGSLITTNQVVNGLYVSTYYAPLASPALTGTPTAPTASAGTNTTQLATTAFVTGAITNHTVNTTAISTTTYTVAATDEYLWFDTSTNAITATLPTAVGKAGKLYTLKRTSSGANNVTIATTSSQTIDGITTYSLSTQWKYVTLFSNGANWLISANN